MRDTHLSTSAVLDARGPYTDPDYTAEFGKEMLDEAKLLVVGAGGLGCEMLKDLALSSFKKIDVIDMDTIELTNLNRQFLFREADVGSSKAEVAARAVNSAVQGVTITPHFCKIQDFDSEFYREFTLVVCGLDNVDARRWLNEMLVSIAVDYGQLIPLIDGGTEGFQGSVKMMIPTLTACFECYSALLPKQTTYPLCTLASTPRLPEHCIEWAHQLEWPKVYPSTPFDADDPEQVNTMYQMSLKRAGEFGIEGVTRSKTLGVVKNIIPAIASTNAIIAAACCNEAFKFVTSCNPELKDSLYYNGEVGEVLVADEYHRLPDCPVCGNLPREYPVAAGLSVKQFAEGVKETFSLDEPDLFYGTTDLYNFREAGDSDGSIGLEEAVPFEEGRCKYQIVVVDRSKDSKPIKLVVTIE